MRSYRTLFRTPEFTPFLLSFAAFAAAQTIGGLALGTLVFRATGSPFLSAVSMFGPQLAQLLGARSCSRAPTACPRARSCPPSPSPSRPARRSSHCPACPSGRSSPSYSYRAWSRRWAAECAVDC